MPYLVSASFTRLLETITLTGDHRATAETRATAIAGMLKKKLTVLETFATGSFVRGTSLKGCADVDVMAVLHYGKHLKDKTPTEALELVREALSDYAAKIVKKNGQAVTLYFATWPNVDVVPAVRIGDSRVFDIPDMNNDRWIRTDPMSHDSAMGGLSPRGRALVRMVKSWNASHSGYLQSFHIEQVVLESFVDSDTWEEDDWPWAVNRFFVKAIELTEPTAPISDSYGTEEWSEIRSRLKRGQELSNEAWHLIYSKKDAKAAIERLRVLFGDGFPAYG